MALLINWDYLVIEEVKPNEVIIRLHADVEHRARFKAQTESKFERTLQWVVSLTVDLAWEVDSTKTIKENLITAWYVTLKAHPDYADAVDA